MEEDIKARLDKLKQHMAGKGFASGKGFTTEVDIQIFSYAPEDEMVVRYFVSQVLLDASLPYRLHELNLYKLFLSICRDKRILDAIPPMEEKKGKKYLLSQLTRLASNKILLSKLNEMPYKEGDVVLLTGVGEAYPFVRVHSLLEAMPSVFENIPVVVFYPGSYNGQELKLFDKLPPSSYYRAFKII
jgi:hypothetical protein